ncbi:MAG: hypothetical protein K5622_00035 [Endomicrobiaceae bacterium]|nr:hypothetical protein [Endomicrobiaceae bacterium]
MKKILGFILLLTMCVCTTTVFAEVSDISNVSITKAIVKAKKAAEEKNKLSKDFENQIKANRDKLIKDYNKQTIEEQKQETADTLFEYNKKALKSMIDNLAPVLEKESEYLDKYYNAEDKEKATVSSVGEFNTDKAYFVINIKYKGKNYSLHYKFKGNEDDTSEIVSAGTAKEMCKTYKLFLVKPLYRIDSATMSPKLVCFRVNHPGTGVTTDVLIDEKDTTFFGSTYSILNTIYLDLLQIEKLSQFPTVKQEMLTELKLIDILSKDKYIEDFKNIIDKNNVTVKIETSPCHSIGIKANGTVVACGLNQNKQCNTDSLNFYIYDSAINDFNTVGLSVNGQIQYCGWNGIKDVDNWKDIVSVKLGKMHAAGLKQDGTVVACGDNSKGQCNVKDWKDIVAIAAGDNHTVGLKKDGTVVACGDNFQGQCNVQDWTDVISIDAKLNITVALKKDETVVACGDNTQKQCNTESWKNITDIALGYVNIAGIKEDGTVVVSGDNLQRQCDVKDWEDITKVCLGNYYIAGLKKDGTVVAKGWNEYGQCNLTGWTNIVDISVSYGHILGLTKDGKVVAAGWNEYGQCNLETTNNN